MIQKNYIDITGIIETLPKIRTIDNKTCCEFLLRSRAYVKSNKVKESFSIPILLSRKNAKRCLKKAQKMIGKQIIIQGQISWNIDPDRVYQGFYIKVEKVTGI